MSWVTYNGQNVMSDKVHISRAAFDRIFELNKNLAGRTGHPMTLMHNGITKYGKYHYEPDGVVYIKKRGKMVPVGRWLKLERINGAEEVACKKGRLDDVADLERIRWQILQRIKGKLVPEMARRVKRLWKYLKENHTKKTFQGYYCGIRYQLTYRGQKGGVEYHWVDPKNDLPVLDQMADNFTSPEDDKMAAYFISMSDRLARAHRSLNTVEGMMLKSMSDQITPNLKKQWEEYDCGELVDVQINGRTYPMWIGNGSLFRNSSRENITSFWPHPDKKVFCLLGQTIEARYA